MSGVNLSFVNFRESNWRNLQFRRSNCLFTQKKTFSTMVVEIN